MPIDVASGVKAFGNVHQWILGVSLLFVSIVACKKYTRLVYTGLGFGNVFGGVVSLRGFRRGTVEINKMVATSRK